jgi:hypothetical protein
MKKAAKKTANKAAKKTVKKKSTVKKTKKATTTRTTKSVKTKPASASAAKGKIEDGMVDKQPQVKEQAAIAHAMFLLADDTWAQRYFDQNDLRFLEREVFG